MGWQEKSPPWVLDARCEPERAREWLENCPCLLTGLRDVELFERRSKKGLKTIYSGERWFKPFLVCGGRVSLPGRLRLISPTYRRRAMRIVRLLKEDPNFSYFGVGLYAVADMISLGVDPKRVKTVAYYVEPGCRKFHAAQSGLVKLLWVGRMIPLKHVDTILKAMKLLPHDMYSLTLVGDGVEKTRLMKLARGLPVTFMPPQPMDKIRELMRQHDIFVFPSNAYEGWGAVVSEALEEGMRVVGSRESGACITMLPESNLFHSGDWSELAKRLSGPIAHVAIGPWSVETGVSLVMELMKGDGN